MPKDTEASVFTRPAAAEIREAWFTLFSDPLLSLANLKAVAAAGLGAPDEEGGILLRSVYWRFYFGLLPPPTSLDLFPPALAASRKAYDDLRARFLVAPDGRWAADCSGGEGYASTTSNGVEWDPLSLDGSSPWKTWFAHLELRETIRQDVDRTFPDIPYFTLERVRKSLTTMLFIFAVLNPDVGYRQGMHELLAVCLMVVDRDSLVASKTPAPSPMVSSPFSPLQRSSVLPSGISEAMVVTLDRAYIEHDAFDLFQELMRPAKSFYEWRTEEGAGVPLQGAPQAPIIERCNHIQGQLLRKIDPQLWERMEQEGVEAQIWAIRWIRLILTRELPFAMALRLWDGIFAADPNLGILDFVCVAMLLLIRNELIEADYPSILTHLLHYPAPSDTYPFNPSLILAQANFLRHDISPTAGVEVVLQNQELLGVKATDRSKINLDIESPTAWRPGGGLTPPPRTNSARDRARAGVSGLAAGLFERAQKAGLDRAFLSTVNDFRNNLPDAATAYSYLPRFSPGPQQDSYSPSPSPSNPFTSAGLPHRQPPPPLHHLPSSGSNMSIKSMLDAERQMADMRLAMLTMGKAMSHWMDTIKEDKAGGPGGEGVAEAWTGLNRVRDSLLDAAGKDVDDMVKDWAWNDDLSSSRSVASSIAPTPVHELPPPLPPQPAKTPTRGVFDETETTTTVHETPKQPGKGRMGPPPPIPILSVETDLPPAPGTARPPGTSTSIDLNASPSPPASAPTSVPTTNISTPLSSAAALALAVSDDNDKKAAPAAKYVTPPPRGASIRASTIVKPAPSTATSTAAGTSAAPTPITPASTKSSGAPSPGQGPSPGSADPLAGLDVGSIPRSTTARHSVNLGHERRRSAWRVVSPTSLSSGSGSGSSSEAVGMDPLGATS